MWVASWQANSRPPESEGFPSKEAAWDHLMTVKDTCSNRIVVWWLDDNAPTWAEREAA